MELFGEAGRHSSSAPGMAVLQSGLAGGVAVGLLVLGGLDWSRQWWRHEQRLKMTPEEWRQEQRLEQTRRPRPARPTTTFQQPGQSVD